MLILVYFINIYNLTGTDYCMDSKLKIEHFNGNKRNPCNGVIHEINKFKHGAQVAFSVFFLLMSSLSISGHTDMMYDLGMPICIYVIINILMYKVTIDGKLKLVKSNDLTAFENNIFEMIDECNRITELGKSVLVKINEQVVPANRLVEVHNQYTIFIRTVSMLDIQEFKESIRSKHFEQKLSILQFEAYYKFHRKIIKCNKASVKLSLMLECMSVDYPDMFK